MHNFTSRKSIRRKVSKRKVSKRKVSKRKVSKLRVGSKIAIKGRLGKTKFVKVRRDSKGRKYYITGKSKSKHLITRKFGKDNPGLLNTMGNFQPPAEMSLAQTITGFPPNQMISHMDDVPSNLRASFNV